MTQTILIGVDDSDNAARAVSLVAKTFNREHEIFLLGVVPNVPAACDLNAETLAAHFKSEQAAFCQVEEQKEIALGNALERAKETLVAAGFDKEKVRVKLMKQEEGIARDIVSEAERLDPQIIVLGRRGLSGFKGFFLGSVSQKVLQLCKDRSVLLVQ